MVDAVASYPALRLFTPFFSCRFSSIGMQLERSQVLAGKVLFFRLDFAFRGIPWFFTHFVTHFFLLVPSRTSLSCTYISCPLLLTHNN